MKKINGFVILILMIVSVSCQKMLEEDVRSQISDGYASTGNGFEQGVNAAYGFLRNFYGSDPYGASITVFGTDTHTNGFDGANKNLNSYNSTLNANDVVITSIWRYMYQAINTCNMVISRAPKVQDIDEATKTIRVAETRFLRAEYYFLLVQLYGPVHITLEETIGVQSQATRSPISDVYDVIIEDLDFAVQQLPVTPSSYGRATKPAAENLLAKVYLTRASSTAAGADDYTKAATLAKNVINNYDFRLVDDYWTLFEQGPNEKNAEVIFAVQNSKDLILAGRIGGNGNSGGNTLHAYFLSKYDDLPGMQRDVVNGRPWATFKPTDFSLNMYDRDLDARYGKMWKRVFYCNRPGGFKVRGRDVTFNLGDTAVYFPDREWTQEELDAVKYTVFPPSLQNERVYPTLTKFLDPERADLQDMRGSRDFVMMRLAETYLIAAEALMMSGNPEEAADYVNAVRRRAAVTGATELETEANRTSMEITPDQLDIDFILDERARELLGEMMRWFDLVRTGKLIERVKLYNPVAAVNIQPYHVLRPIPQAQIDRTDGEFPQNPGYN